MSSLRELVGWAATGVFAGSYLCREPQTLRKVQAFAAILWIRVWSGDPLVPDHRLKCYCCNPRELVRLSGWPSECTSLSTVSGDVRLSGRTLNDCGVAASALTSCYGV